MFLCRSHPLHLGSEDATLRHKIPVVELHDYLAQMLVVVRLNIGQARRLALPPNADELLKTQSWWSTAGVTPWGIASTLALLVKESTHDTDTEAPYVSGSEVCGCVIRMPE